MLIRDSFEGNHICYQPSGDCHDWLGKESWSWEDLMVFGRISLLTMLSLSLNSHQTKQTRESCNYLTDIFPSAIGLSPVDMLYR